MLFRRVLFLLFLSCFSYGVIFFGYQIYVRVFNPYLYISPLSNVLSGTYVRLSGTQKSHEQEIKTLLEKKHIPFSHVASVDKGLIRVLLKDNQEILFSTSKSLESQTSSLQLVLSRLTIEGKRFTKIDFRFDKPVIVF